MTDTVVLPDWFPARKIRTRARLAAARKSRCGDRPSTSHGRNVASLDPRYASMVPRAARGSNAVTGCPSPVAVDERLKDRDEDPPDEPPDAGRDRARGDDHDDRRHERRRHGAGARNAPHRSYHVRRNDAASLASSHT